MSSHNLERLTRLRDHIAALPPERFSMNHWAIDRKYEVELDTVYELIHDCGTCACIGGWTDALFMPPDTLFWDGSTPKTGALLGLNYEESTSLFMPMPANTPSWSPYATWRDVTQADAVTTLTKLIETGKVDWSHVQPQPQTQS